VFKLKEFNLTKSALIEASAGTGKTYTLVRLALHYLIEGKIEPNQLVLVTFTRNAAGELTGRLLALIKEELLNEEQTAANPGRLQRLRTIYQKFSSLTIATIHSFCQNLLAGYPFEAARPFQLNLSAGSDWQSAQLQKFLLGYEAALTADKTKADAFNLLLTKYHSFEGVVNYFLQLINKINPYAYNINPAADINNLKEFPAEENTSALLAYITGDILSHILPRLAQKRQEDGDSSFNDLLYDTMFLLQSRPQLLKAVQANYKVALIDEFQDTDYAQWQIFNLIFSGDDRRLVVIGDPKQSIYNFRGANLQVYQQAARQINHSYHLNVNYRSLPGIIKPINLIFSTLFNDYKEVAAADNPATALHLCYNQQEETALSFVKIESEAVSSDELRQDIIKAMVQQVSNLLSGNYRLCRLDEQGKIVTIRAVKASDIAIIATTGNDLRRYKRLLEQQQIAAVLHSGQSSVLKSNEAYLLTLLLSYLAGDEAKLTTLLMSPLFALTNRQLTADHNQFITAVTLLAEVAGLAANGNWAKALDKLWRESGYLQRLLQPQEVTISELAESEERERAYVNINHLSELIISQSNKQSSPQAMQRYLLQLINNEQDSEQLRLERDDEAVTLITVHKAKGLQYKIVFVHVGLNQPMSPHKGDSYYLMRNNNGSYLIDFDKTTDHKEQLKKHEEKERERLFYVALTRAESKLYLPYTYGPTYKDPSKARWPYASFLSAHNKEELYLTAKELINAGKPLNPLTIPAGSSCPTGEQPFNLAKLKPLNLNKRLIAFSSYSSLYQKAKQDYSSGYHEAQLKLAEAISGEETESQAGNNRQHPLGQPQNIRGSAAFGLALHSLFENIGFSAAATPLDNFLADKNLQKQINSLAGSYLPLTAKAELEALSTLFWHSLNQPIKALNGFALKDIKEKRHELDFLLTLKESYLNSPIFTGRLEAGFLKGFIDLIFKHDNRYYLLDWKTTKLGDSFNHYSQPKLPEALQQHGYRLQYYLYLHAFYRYAKTIDKNFTYDAIGGVIYCFNRAMHASHNDDTAIFFDKPSYTNYLQFASHFNE